VKLKSEPSYLGQLHLLPATHAAMAALSDHVGSDNTSAPQTRGQGAEQSEVTA